MIGIIYTGESREELIGEINKLDNKNVEYKIFVEPDMVDIFNNKIVESKSLSCFQYHDNKYKRYCYGTEVTCVFKEANKDKYNEVKIMENKNYNVNDFVKEMASVWNNLSKEARSIISNGIADENDKYFKAIKKMASLRQFRD